ncbi:hypothetical protein OU798_08960 [Prolixibacteraceae bacterium Z1-6]|uniref:Uncharacterized protein n=1 Tax=Draconibacterium aestuarii TaxID=2998507 RepID=A0A9X3F4T3_9BACT|nr:hypothetical protein [Prolixibacteraceae bacterium Z1-6]
MKRNLIIILVVLLASVAGFIYFTKEDIVFQKETSLYKAVPVTSPVFVEFSSLKAIPAENPILQELAGIEDFSWILRKIKEIDVSIKGDKEIQNQLGKKPVILALDFIGKNVLKPLIISDLRSSAELEGFEKLMGKLTGVPVTAFQQRKYDDAKIVDIIISEGKKSIHYCAVEGMIIISSEAILVEKSIRQLNSQNITDITYFNTVKKTVTNQSEISWYINHNRFPELWANFLNGNWQTKENEFGETVKTNMKRAVLGIQNYASWSELDMSIDKERISLNGITAADDSLNNFLSVFEGQEAVSCQADRILPKNTSFFIGFSFSNRGLFFQNLDNYFVHSNSYFEREGHMKTIRKRFKDNEGSKLKSLVKDRVVAATTSVSGQAGGNASLFIISTGSATQSIATFENLLQNFAKSKEVEFASLVSEYVADDGNNYKIYDFPYPSLPGIWLGKSFSFAEAKYATFWKDNLVFASSKETLQKYLSDMINEATLRRSRSYSEFKALNESKANINAYVDINKIYALNKSLLDDSFSKSFETNEEIFRKFDAFSWQVVCENKIYFNSINLRYNAQPKSETRALWQSNIGAAISSKPQIVINHRNKAAKEVIVQDDKNKLHLITADGKMVWSIPIKGKILGEVHQVDYYGNGRLQYLFNTKEKLYLLDRNGNHVAKFPIMFKSPATNGVGVFDYDNNHKYRFFVACENKRIYAYSHEGEIIDGWKFGQTNSAVTTPVQHFRVNNMDYIVFKDKLKIYIQNRQGNARVNCSAKFENSNNPLVLNTNGTPKIVATDKNGKVYYIYFDGKFAEKKTDKFSADHFFTVSDIDGNGIPDFIFVDGKELNVMDENGKKLFTKKISNTLELHANLYSFSAKQIKIGVTDSRSNQIYLYDSNGNLHSGFPLSGNSEFSIGNLKGTQLSLVVGSSEGNLYNYTLE